MLDPEELSSTSSLMMTSSLVEVLYLHSCPFLPREDIYTLQINADSGINPDHLSYFHFVGRIIGMAVFHGHYVDGGFTMPFYKMLLNKAITLEDIEDVDPTLHKGLQWMLDNNIDGDGVDEDSKVIDTTFSVEHEAFGVVRTHELKKGGKTIPVSTI